MKKFLSFILVLLLVALPFVASAAAPDFTNIMMGDLNGDNKVTAMDARKALRYAAKLDSAAELNILSIDADGDMRITAGDARIILRVSAQISRFTYGYDGKGTPNAVNTLHNSMYSLDIVNFDETQNAKMSFTVAKDDNDVYMLSEDKTLLDSMGMGGLMKITKCGMMVTGGNIYALMGTPDADIAMFIPPEMQEDMDMTADMVYEIVEMIDTFVPENLGEPVLTTLNGKDMLCYNYIADGQQCQLFINAENGQLTHIDGLLKNGDAETMIKFNKISGDKPTKYFDLNNFDEIW